MSTNAFNVLTFPVWWYSEGLVLAWRHMQSRMNFVLRSTGLVIFLRNLFQPLYGDYSRSGRLISFFIRIVLLVFILTWSVLRLAFVFLGFVLHVFALPVTVVMIVYQLFPT